MTQSEAASRLPILLLGAAGVLFVVAQLLDPQPPPPESLQPREQLQPRFLPAAKILAEQSFRLGAIEFAIGVKGQPESLDRARALGFNAVVARLSADPTSTSDASLDAFLEKTSRRKLYVFLWATSRETESPRAFGDRLRELALLAKAHPHIIALGCSAESSQQAAAVAASLPPGGPLLACSIDVSTPDAAARCAALPDAFALVGAGFDPALGDTSAFLKRARAVAGGRTLFVQGLPLSTYADGQALHSTLFSIREQTLGYVAAPLGSADLPEQALSIVHAQWADNVARALRGRCTTWVGPQLGELEGGHADGWVGPTLVLPRPLAAQKSLRLSILLPEGDPYWEAGNTCSVSSGGAPLAEFFVPQGGVDRVVSLSQAPLALTCEVNFKRTMSPAARGASKDTRALAAIVRSARFETR